MNGQEMTNEEIALVTTTAKHFIARVVDVVKVNAPSETHGPTIIVFVFVTMLARVLARLQKTDDTDAVDKILPLLRDLYKIERVRVMETRKTKESNDVQH